MIMAGGPRFTKLASTILKSSIWMEDCETRIVWIAMLADCDAYGKVIGTVPGLANLYRVPVEKCREALAKFMEPDPESQDPSHEGRRIKKVEGGWQILNYVKYMEIYLPPSPPLTDAQRQERHRQKLKEARGE
jgi:hypothetical protein